MKSINLIIISVLAFGFIGWKASAQDTLKYGDPWYLFKNNDSVCTYDYQNNLLDHDAVSTVIGSYANYSDFSLFLVNPYITSNYNLDNGSFVYGVAIASPDISTVDNTQPCVMLAPSGRPGGWEIGDSTYALDTATYNQCLKQCRYILEYTFPKPSYDTFECYEYYFRTPIPVNTLTDTFFAGVYITHENFYNYRNIPNGRSDFRIASGLLKRISHQTELRWSSFWGGRYHHDDPTHYGFFSSTGAWTCIFPIISLRCVSPKVRLVERANGMVTVRWIQAEAGMEYQVAYGPYNVMPDSATVLTMTDTFCTVPEMDEDGIQAVWVRKACRYNTGGYDTTVWSDWSLPMLFRTEAAGMEQVFRDGARISTHEGTIAIENECGELPEVSVYDVMGRCLWCCAGGRSQQVPVPPGIYTVRIGHSPARKVSVLR